MILLNELNQDAMTSMNKEATSSVDRFLKVSEAFPEISGTPLCNQFGETDSHKVVEAILPKIRRLRGKRSTFNELDNKKPAPPMVHNLSDKVSLMYTVVQSWHERLQTSWLALSLGIESLVSDFPRVLIEVNATRIPSSASKQGFIKGPFLRAKDCAQHQTC